MPPVCWSAAATIKRAIDLNLQLQDDYPNDTNASEALFDAGLDAFRIDDDDDGDQGVAHVEQHLSVERFASGGVVVAGQGRQRSRAVVAVGNVGCVLWLAGG